MPVEAEMYKLLKDIVVPLAAPLIAITTLLLFAHNERTRFEIAAEHKVDARAGAVKRDLEILLATYAPYAVQVSVTMDANRIKMIDDTSERLFGEIYRDPLVYKKYFKGKHLPLLLSELEVRLKDEREDAKSDLFIYFALLALLSEIENDEQKKTEINLALDEFVKAKPEWSPFIEKQ